MLYEIEEDGISG